MYPDLDLKHLASLVVQELRKTKVLSTSDLKNGDELSLALAAAKGKSYQASGGFDMNDQRWHGSGAGLDAAVTLTNKRITPRVLSAANYTTDTGTSLNCDNLDQFIVTAQAGDLKFNNPTGTPTDGQKLIIACTGTAARALTWGTQFEASTVALPTTTVLTARLNMGFIWRADTSKWVCVAVA